MPYYAQPSPQYFQGAFMPNNMQQQNQQQQQSNFIPIISQPPRQQNLDTSSKQETS